MSEPTRLLKLALVDYPVQASQSDTPMWTALVDEAVYIYDFANKAAGQAFWIAQAHVVAEVPINTNMSRFVLDTDSDYAQGYADGYTAGDAAGQITGYAAGYAVGYADGLAAAGGATVTINPGNAGANAGLSGGNLHLSMGPTGGNNDAAFATLVRTTGKRCFRWNQTARVAPQGAFVGWGRWTAPNTAPYAFQAGAIGLRTDTGTSVIAGVETAYLGGAVPDVCTIDAVLNIEGDEMTFYIDGVSAGAVAIA